MEKSIVIEAPQTQKVVVVIEGVGPGFLSHRKSEDITLAWRKKLEGKSEKKKPFDVKQALKNSLYIDPETKKPGVLAKALKAAIVSAAIAHQDKTLKRRIRAAVFIPSEIIPFSSYKDMVERVEMLPLMGGRSQNLSCRYEFKGWKLEVPIEFNSNLIDVEAVINLLHFAGFSIGVGDHRPEKGTGVNGRFRVIGTKKAK